jgi:glycine/D-amino acid oxidase-like deaminating enzyme
VGYNGFGVGCHWFSLQQTAMPALLVVGGGLFGSLAAAYARQQGIEAVVFDAQMPGAASPAAAGLFCQAWAGRNLRSHYEQALPLLERLYEIRTIALRRDDATLTSVLFVPPAEILEPSPTRQVVTAVGDGWLEAGGQRYEGWVYVAAGIWCVSLVQGLEVHGKAGAAFLFAGERPGRIHQVAPRRQAIAFVRDRGTTYFSDGTAERDYTPQHDRQTLDRAAALGLTDEPIERHWGSRPYTPGGPLFQKWGQRTWVATGGRKMGTILGASFARRLVEEELAVGMARFSL